MGGQSKTEWGVNGDWNSQTGTIERAEEVYGWSDGQMVVQFKILSTSDVKGPGDAKVEFLTAVRFIRKLVTVI